MTVTNPTSVVLDAAVAGCSETATEKPKPGSIEEAVKQAEADLIPYFVDTLRRQRQLRERRGINFLVNYDS
jgi:hypothetical protein